MRATKEGLFPHRRTAFHPAVSKSSAPFHTRDSAAGSEGLSGQRTAASPAARLRHNAPLCRLLGPRGCPKSTAAPVRGQSSQGKALFLFLSRQKRRAPSLPLPRSPLAELRQLPRPPRTAQGNGSQTRREFGTGSQ